VGIGLVAALQQLNHRAGLRSHRVLAGSAEVTLAGWYLVSVYGDDPMTAGLDEWAEAGDTIAFIVDGHRPVPFGRDPPAWGQAGTRLHGELHAGTLAGDFDCVAPQRPRSLAYPGRAPPTVIRFLAHFGRNLTEAPPRAWSPCLLCSLSPCHSPAGTHPTPAGHTPRGPARHPSRPPEQMAA